MRILDEVVRAPVVITAGTGGVGKTTMSVAVAIAIAQEHSARVLVLTIDPARRLADVLSEKHLTHTPSRVDHARFVEGTAQGELFAAMVETDEGWKEIITRYAKSDKDADRIFENRLFQNLTTRFSHSHDFVAMDQLYEHYRSGQYDYIVLDTPPTSQAFGFFDAPQAMSEFFGGRLVRLVTSPYRLGSGRAAKLFDLASQPFFALADKVLGKQFLNDIGEFFFLFHTMYDDFAERSNDITAFLTSSRVHSTLVTNPAQFCAGEDKDVLDGLTSRKIHPCVIFINGVAFSPEQFSDITSFLASASDDDFTEFVARDHDISVQVYRELARRSGGFGAANSDSERTMTTIGRIAALDEVQRVKELVASVQSASSDDDTM
jgi:anion-transporting  ArsA/GET3 family ATPase